MRLTSNKNIRGKQIYLKSLRLIMGRKTFCKFDFNWPYTKPVFVLRNSLKNLSEEYNGTTEVLAG